MADSVLALAEHPPEHPTERKKLYKAAQKLMFSVESTYELEHRVYYGGILLYVANVAIDLGIFKALADTHSSGLSAHELAKAVCGEELLVSRITRGLAAYGLVDINPSGLYTANANTHRFTDPGVESGVHHNVLNMFPAIHSLPQWLRTHDMQSPTDVHDTAFQLGFNTKDEPFTWFAAHPENLQAGAAFMSAQRADQKGWIEDDTIFPSQDLTLSPTDLAANRVLFIDIGGGVGHQSIALRTHRPNLQGRILLQDLPHTLALADTTRLLALDIETMSYDCHTPQPIAGAKAYYMRNVLHDWTDSIALTFLRNQRSAMADDSVLIIDEMVVKDPGSTWQQVNIDIAMMAAMGSLERTEAQWRALLGDFRGAGLIA
ncbi:hypothetical protein PRZ48_002719 [Zasmidium cellare]|uniref:O-methyltransferase domain-containing protein n=1 Tax=Zasmidium cellare TaxID=395010 RepID=A0ABR0ETD3_ZASCE|nr:hypothetical protein PRZ48_002719 [Zasmidium cellare]